MGTPSRPPNEKPNDGSVLDLSNGGMKIKTRKLGFSKGLILKVWLPVSRVDVSVPVLTEVRWMKEERPGNFYAGLSFVV